MGRIYSLVLVFALIGEVEATDTLLVGSSESPPYTSIKLPHGGFVNHVISEVLHSAGYEVKFEYLNWSRIYQQAEEGKYNLITYAYEKSLHQDDFLVSRAVTLESLHFLHLNTSPMPDWQTFDDLEGKRLGLTRGYTYTRALWAYADRNLYSTSVVNTDAQNIRMLIRGRIDLFPIGRRHGEYLLTNQFTESKPLLSFDSKPLVVTKGHVLFPKVIAESAALQKTFDHHLTLLENSGRLAKLKKRLDEGLYH